MNKKYMRHREGLEQKCANRTLKKTTLFKKTMKKIKSTDIKILSKLHKKLIKKRDKIVLDIKEIDKTLGF